MIAPGTRLGPYEIISLIGAGGMGEVYRGRDTRLGRDVAVKVLPENLLTDRDRLSRFEKEARAASALNHPNVVTVYDIGFQDSTPYLAMELVEGSTLRQLLDGGPLPVRKLLEIATQVAEGLAKAHSAGIVHRDFKPENVMISKDGYAKILDFGLAKLIEGPSEDASELPTAVRAGTTPGMVMGTVGYMSPEQASGRVVDYHTDQFSLGTILYEMITGRRAFRRSSTAETLVAIMHEDPEPITQLNARAPVALRWIVERCLAKDPEERYASSRDLAQDLATLRDRLSETLQSGQVPAAQSAEVSHPTFQRQSFRRGTILSARFATDGQTVIYGASWEGSPCRLFSTRLESPESSPLMLPDAEILSISRSGLMAISLDRRWAGRFIWAGTLAQSPQVGGAPREILEDVQWADWGPDGSSLAIVRHIAGKHRLEYPIGNILYETAGWISHPRVSPKEELVAFLDHPVQGDDSGSVVVIDRNRKVTTLSSDWITVYGLAWSADGKEIWFTATRVGVARSIWAVTTAGSQERLLARTPGELTIQDVSREGRVLITSDNGKVGIIGLPPGQSKEKDLSLLDWSLVRAISNDGKFLLFDESGEGGGAAQSVYVRKTDGSPAVRLGDGRAFGFSPDERWVASTTVVPPRETVLLPVKTGEPRILTRHGLSVQAAHYCPDGKRILFAANESDQGVRLYIQDINGNELRPISSEGVGVGFFPISPDGKSVVAQGPDQFFYLYPLDGGEPQSIPSLAPDDRPMRWTPVGQSLYIFRRGELPGQVFLLDLSTGRKEPVRELMPPDPAGVVEIVSVQLTPDAASYAYSYHRILSDLFLVEGLK